MNRITISTNQIRCPCVRECERRSPTCHAECEEYAKYAEECERLRQKKAKLGNTYTDAAKLRYYERVKKYGR